VFLRTFTIIGVSVALVMACRKVFTVALGATRGLLVIGVIVVVFVVLDGIVLVGPVEPRKRREYSRIGV